MEKHMFMSLWLAPKCKQTCVSGQLHHCANEPWRIWTLQNVIELRRADVHWNVSVHLLKKPHYKYVSFLELPQDVAKTLEILCKYLSESVNLCAMSRNIVWVAFIQQFCFSLFYTANSDVQVMSAMRSIYGNGARFVTDGVTCEIPVIAVVSSCCFSLQLAILRG